MIKPSDFDAADDSGVAAAPVTLLEPPPRVKWLAWWQVTLLAALLIAGYFVSRIDWTPQRSVAPVSGTSSNAFPEVITPPAPPVDPPAPPPADPAPSDPPPPARLLLAYVGEDVIEIDQDDLDDDEYVTERDVSFADAEGEADREQGQWYVRIDFTQVGAARFRRMWAAHQGPVLGLFIEGRRIFASHTTGELTSSVMMIPFRGSAPATALITSIGGVCTRCVTPQAIPLPRF